MKQENFLFVDVVSSIFLLILMMGNFMGLLYITSGNYAISLLISLFIVVCYYFIRNRLMHGNIRLFLHMVSASFPKHGRPLLTDAKGFRIYFFAKVSPPILSTSLAGEMPDGVRKLSHWNRYSMKKNGSTVSVWKSILIISRVYSSVATGKP